MNKIVIVVIGVLRYQNKYLLTYRDEKSSEEAWANHHWQFPGGGIEYGETPEQTLKREMKEELGIDIKKSQLIPKLISKTRNNWQGILISYLCHLDKVPYVILNNEASKFSWFNIEEIQKLDSLPGAVEIAIEAEKIY